MGKMEDAIRKAKEDGGLTQVTARYMKLEEPGSMLVGKLLAVSETKSRQNPGVFNVYTVHTTDEVVRFSMGAVTDQEIAPSLKIGKVYSFEFMAKEPLPGGRHVNRWEVNEIPPEVFAELSDGDDNIPF